MSRTQLFDTGTPIRIIRRRTMIGVDRERQQQRERERRRIESGKNLMRMRARGARAANLTLPEYEERLYEKAERRAKREDCIDELAERRYEKAERWAKRRDCSVDEIRDAVNANARARYAMDPTTWYRAAYARRARKQNAAVVEDINRIDILERDRWICRYCGKRTRDDVPRGHPDKAIVAHIVALAAGGNHSRDNVCCLCHECNTKDGINQLPIQYALDIEEASL